MEMFLQLPLWYSSFIVFCFGVIIGSFLNVVIYRFHTGKSLAGSSHCLSCQTDLRWYELFPLVSYVFLRGRCRTCSASIPSRYFWVEALTGILFVTVFINLSPLWWPLAIPLVSLLVVVAVYDMYHLVIPYLFVTVLWGIAVATNALSYWLVPSHEELLYRVLAALLGYGFFALLWYVSNGRWIGYGDALLAAPLAAILGLAGTFSMIVLAFWIGTCISLVLLAFLRLVQKRGQYRLRFLQEPLTMKSEVPFAPFLILGFLSVYLLGADVLAAITYVLPV